MPLSNKMRQDWAPILFFGLFVATKTYYLIVYLTSSEDLWGLLGNIDRLDDFGPGDAFFLTGGLSYILYYVTALAFDILVFFSFVGRVEVRERPKGFWENVYPLVTVFLPVTGFTLLFIPEVRQLVPGFSETTVEAMRNLSPIFPFYMNMMGTLTGLAGAAFSIWALSYLRRSFGLRTAVRKLVTSERPLPLGPPSALRRRDRPCPWSCDTLRDTRGLLPVHGRCGPPGSTGQDRGAEVPAHRA